MPRIHLRILSATVVSTESESKIDGRRDRTDAVLGSVCDRERDDFLAPNNRLGDDGDPHPKLALLEWAECCLAPFTGVASGSSADVTFVREKLVRTVPTSISSSSQMSSRRRSGLGLGMLYGK